MTAHKLVCDWQGGGTVSSHTCAGCDWYVESYTKPNQATAHAVQVAFDKHLEPAGGLDPDVLTDADLPDWFTIIPGLTGAG